MKDQYTLGELATLFSVKSQGNLDQKISGIASLDRAQPNQISFLIHPKFRPFLADTEAGAVIISSKDCSSYQGNALITENPHLIYAKVAELFVTKTKKQSGIHPTAIIGKNCNIANSASIAPYCVIGDDVKIGEHVVIGPGSSIGDHCVIDANSQLAARVTLYPKVKIGRNALIHSGAVLGADGFGMIKDGNAWRKIPQLGSVVVGDDVEIGANTTIDCGALESTVIGNGVKLDNQIQIAHNVQVGDHTVIAGCSAIAGSSKIGKHCILAGAVQVSDHVTIADQVIIGGASIVEKSIEQPGAYATPVGSIPAYKSKKVLLLLQRLEEIMQRLRKLERKDEPNEH